MFSLYETVKLIRQILIVLIGGLALWMRYSQNYQRGDLISILSPLLIVLTVVVGALYIILYKLFVYTDITSRINAYLIAILMALLVTMIYIYVV